jgi:hydrogenase nickel incorporation protein HypA/HybF
VHELSIAMSLVDAACEEAERLGDVRVVALRVRLGPLSGVVSDALSFSFDVATQGTAIQGARLDIEIVRLAVYCPVCAAEREPTGPQHLRCPVCATPTPRVLRGRELELAAMEVVDREPAHR